MPQRAFKHNNTSSPPADWVTLLQADAPVRLVCFHFAGGSAQSFFPWRVLSDGACELIAAELPGRNRRYHEPFCSSILEAAESFAQTFSRLPPKPTVFYGHSLGALLAYETTRELSQLGQMMPQRLIVSSRAAPVKLPSSIGLPVLSDDALLSYLSDLRGTKTEVLKNKALMSMMLPIIRSDLQLIYDYQHQSSPFLEVPVDVIGAIDDVHCPLEWLLGWRDVTRGKFALHMIPGGHFAPLANPDWVLNTVRSIGAGLS